MIVIDKVRRIVLVNDERVELSHNQLKILMLLEKDNYINTKELAKKLSEELSTNKIAITQAISSIRLKLNDLNSIINRINYGYKYAEYIVIIDDKTRVYVDLPNELFVRIEDKCKAREIDVQEYLLRAIENYS